jgi:hypothetical protein
LLKFYEMFFVPRRGGGGRLGIKRPRSDFLRGNNDLRGDNKASLRKASPNKSIPVVEPRRCPGQGDTASRRLFLPPFLKPISKKTHRLNIVLFFTGIRYELDEAHVRCLKTCSHHCPCRDPHVSHSSAVLRTVDDKTILKRIETTLPT